MSPNRANHKLDRTRAGTKPKNAFLRAIALLEDAILVVLLSGMILLAAVQILLRNFLDMGLAWGDQVLRVSVLWVGLIGGVVASRENKHINVDVFLRFLSGRARVASQGLIGLFTAAVCAVIAFYAGRFVRLDYQSGILAFGSVPVWIVELILPVGFGLIALRYTLLTAAQFSRLFAKENNN
jgi:TRAP-type C4-dicarboxylate transport system permease small subunit